MPNVTTAISRAYQYLVGLWRQPHWWAETWSGIVMVGWSLSSLLGTPLSDRPAYDALLTTAPALFWQIGGLAAGVSQLSFLLLNNRWLRAFAAALSGYLFTCVMVSFARENHYPPAMALYGGYVGINLMAMYKQLRGRA